MNATTSPGRDQRTIDLEHLRLLSIFHFVGTGFAVLGLLFLVAHFTFMHAMLSDPKFFRGAPGSAPPEMFITIMNVVYTVVGLWMLLSGILNLASALSLRAHKHRTFSQVVGVFNCLHIPMGTVLGVFTLIVLSRESVRELYLE